MTSMRRHYVASTSLRRHVPAGNLPRPPWPLKYSKPCPPPPPQYSKPSYAYEKERHVNLAQALLEVYFAFYLSIYTCLLILNE